jgi:hypothetical protein
VEPVNFQALPATLFEELLHQVGDHVPAVIDLTPTTDTLALCCLEKGIPYLGICFTTAHVDMLQQRLKHRAFVLQHSSTSPLYKAGQSLLMRKMGLATSVACPAGTTKPDAEEEGGEEDISDEEEEGGKDDEEGEGSEKPQVGRGGRGPGGRGGRGKGRARGAAAASTTVAAAAAHLAEQMLAVTGGASGSADRSARAVF